MATHRQFGRRMAPVLLVLVWGCVPEGFPEDPRINTETDLPQPEIVPVQPILDLAQSAEETPDPEDPDPALRLRGEELRARTESAATVTTIVTTPLDDDLQERSSTLRSRADAVRAAPVE